MLVVFSNSMGIYEFQFRSKNPLHPYFQYLKSKNRFRIIQIFTDWNFVFDAMWNDKHSHLIMGVRCFRIHVIEWFSLTRHSLKIKVSSTLPPTPVGWQCVNSTEYSTGLQQLFYVLITIRILRMTGSSLVLYSSVCAFAFRSCCI